MILISIFPFAPRKLFTLAVAITCMATASCFASSVFFSVDSTPYDVQMSRIRPVLMEGGRREHNVPVALVNNWMQDLRDIPYGYQMQWKTPDEVQTRQPADCKGKAVALYRRMQLHGANNVKLVIGRRAPSSRMTHAWLEWETADGVYVLDPTFNWVAFRAEQMGRRSYIPLYAYGGGKKYRAAGAETLVAGN